MEPREPNALAGRGDPATPAARLLWLPPVLLSAWCFYPITANYFFGDDLYNLYEIVNRGVVEYLVKPYGGHLLAARNLVYYVCFRLFGTNPEPYFWVVLLTHLFNVLLVFRILSLLAGPRLGCVGATLWGTAPVDEGALGWFSVYGQVLATAFILWVLYRLAQVAAGATFGPTAPLRWAALLFLASLSFGTGIGAALAFPFVALVLLPPSSGRRWVLLALFLIAFSIPVLYVASHWLAELYKAPSTGELGGPLGVRLLWHFGWRLTSMLASYGVTSLLLGPFWYPLPYPNPSFDVVPAVAVVALLAALALGTAAHRRRLLAMLGLAVASYGIIAAGRAPFFLLFGNNIVTSARYHYFATVPLCIALFVTIAVFARWRPLPRRWQTPALAAALAVIVAPHALGTPPIDHHDRERTAAAKAVASIQQQIDAAPPGADVYINNQRFDGVGPMMIQRPDLFPGLAAIFAIYFPEIVVDGKRVLFVIWNPDTLAAAERGRKTGWFVIHPSRRPAGDQPPVEPPADGAPP
jgi:hypothetical protein